jgi:hypothetical protein
MSDPWRNALLLLLTAAVAFGVCLAVRHALRHRRFEQASWSATLSYVATAYGVVVGFSILFLFGQYADARSAVGDEATSIGTAYEQAALFPDSGPGIQRALVCYARAVPTYDWPALQDHRGAPEVDEAFSDLVASLGEGDQPPVGALHAGAATNLNNQIGSISTARETRLVAAETQVPTMLWILLFGGGALVVCMIFVLTMPAYRITQAVLVAMTTAFTAVLLLLVLALSTPFGTSGGRVTPALIEETTATMESTASADVAAPCDG